MDYPLVNVYCTLNYRTSPFYSWVNQLFLWPCSIAMLVYQRVNLHFPMVFLWFSYGSMAIFNSFLYVYQAGYQMEKNGWFLGAHFRSSSIWLDLTSWPHVVTYHGVSLKIAEEFRWNWLLSFTRRCAMIGNPTMICFFLLYTPTFFCMNFNRNKSIYIIAHLYIYIWFISTVAYVLWSKPE